ncbi:3-oxo-5-alpha-steroid 4- [Stylonychia lemnae]|uniref:3-oxo-5-alpha-steroid 4 n=1 Tax=Stylonychia lemnae TaxID=5949 RepID=A0A078B8D2_STYLE|nr:3-oxo-5-alpha-steroid 4- [Stylonychia lemnae]|eukprot:CDW90664.1 3-oxo-5-alpha-steroid 4- [Stylonychia lemnae]
MEAFDIFVRNYDDGKPMITLTVSSNTQISKLKKQFAEQYSDLFYPEKQQFWHDGIAMKRDYMTLDDYDVKAGDTVYIQDMGIQVSYRLSKILINIGPLITFTLFNFYWFDIYSFCLNDHKYVHQNSQYSRAQQLGNQMVFIHFGKRIYECIFVHYFSKSSKSLNKLIWEFGYIWLFFGLVVPFYLFHPDYNESLLKSIFYEDHIPQIYFFLFLAFIFFEVMNFFCHVHLKSFRVRDLDTTRGIPRLHGFSYVSCANYFYEILAWVCFAIVTQTLMSTTFLFTSFFRMNSRAQKKHLRYIAEFKNYYPAEERRAFIPFLF